MSGVGEENRGRLKWIMAIEGPFRGVTGSASSKRISLEAKKYGVVPCLLSIILFLS